MVFERRPLRGFAAAAGRQSVLRDEWLVSAGSSGPPAGHHCIRTPARSRRTANSANPRGRWQITAKPGFAADFTAFGNGPRAGKPRNAAGYNLSRCRPSAATGSALPRRCSRTASSTSSRGSIPSIPALIFVPVVVVVRWLGLDRGYGVLQVAGLFALGLLIWTLTEYWLHRLVFHWEPDLPLGGDASTSSSTASTTTTPTTRCGWSCPRRSASRSPHCSSSALHPDLRDAGRLPHFRRLHRRLPRLRLHALTTSTTYVPKSPFGKRCANSHMRHHFQDHRYGFGVSSPLWDVVFRTTFRAPLPELNTPHPVTVLRCDDLIVTYISVS